MSKTLYAFDLDSTITKAEILPYLAKELKQAEEMDLLTRQTLEGFIPFDVSLTKRFNILRHIPLKRVHELLSELPLDQEIVEFIRTHQTNSIVITGNIDVWLKPIIVKLGCPCLSSITCLKNNILELIDIMDKGKAISKLKNEWEKIIAIGDSTNDIPMFQLADMSIAYAGVHKINIEVAKQVDFIFDDSKELCAFLNQL
ncbi:HAD-IB family phosphatase [Desulfovibrio litoralis]|uniref:phosphoserine phosphatase n=1 Tax=Desulfovibrio litoralis DSM 11393 TaxID=1121455 RepID=A0A1M7SYI7_9BACT|nr:HAD-IB family phosphatase [Desulfovibrio litoralis]SHN63506.1 Haloacid Dehalogenase superfamily, subfamily IB, phosphoserine phosphatase-like [Desulfovibrio litoralis DSM 11393]